MDVLVSSRSLPKDDVYWITHEYAGFIPVYCSFELNPTRAWTLIESFAHGKRSEFRDKPFYNDYSVYNNNPPSWERFRMGLGRMKYIRSKSTLFRATCDFPKRNGSLTPDLLIGRLSDVDIINHNSSYGHCKEYIYINIKGHNCTNCTSLTYQDSRHFRIFAALNYGCQFKPPLQETQSYFGGYWHTYKISKCTSTPSSTTQWWLGEDWKNDM